MREREFACTPWHGNRYGHRGEAARLPLQRAKHVRTSRAGAQMRHQVSRRSIHRRDGCVYGRGGSSAWRRFATALRSCSLRAEVAGSSPVAPALYRHLLGRTRLTVASSAALLLPTFFTAWIVSAGTSKTSPALSVVGGLPST
jgi:hypothetical protein